MILRRVIKHFKNQEWTAIFLDFLIVVVGVFVGLQVSNWNDVRADRDREQSLIMRLTTDFEGISSRLADSVDRYNEYINATEHVYQIVEARTPPKGEANKEYFATALLRVLNTRMPAGFSTTFLEMRASGDIDLLQNTDLKAALIEYDKATQIALTGFDVLSDRNAHYGEPLFRHNRYKADKGATDGTTSYFIEAYDFQGMIEDPDFLPAISALITVHANNRVLQVAQLERAADVLSVLRQGAE